MRVLSMRGRPAAVLGLVLLATGAGCETMETCRDGLCGTGSSSSTKYEPAASMPAPPADTGLGAPVSTGVPSGTGMTGGVAQPGMTPATR